LHTYWRKMKHKRGDVSGFIMSVILLLLAIISAVLIFMMFGSVIRLIFQNPNQGTMVSFVRLADKINSVGQKGMEELVADVYIQNGFMIVGFDWVGGELVEAETFEGLLAAKKSICVDIPLLSISKFKFCFGEPKPIRPPSLEGAALTCKNSQSACLCLCSERGCHKKASCIPLNGKPKAPSDAGPDIIKEVYVQPREGECGGIPGGWGTKKDERPGCFFVMLGDVLSSGPNRVKLLRLTRDGNKIKIVMDDGST